MKKLLLKSCSISFLFLSFLVEAEKPKQGLNSPYISMYTSKNWVCLNFPPNHICHPKNIIENKIILVLISAKMGLKSDSLEVYKSTKRRSGFQEIKRLTLNSHNWIDFLPNLDSTQEYIIRSQAGICCDEVDYTFHVTVNFYVSKWVYSEYLSLIVRMINSFNLKKNNIDEIRQLLENQDPKELEKLQDYIGNILSEEESAKLDAPQKEKETSFWRYLLIPVFVISSYFFIKRRRRKKKMRLKKKNLRKRRVKNV